MLELNLNNKYIISYLGLYLNVKIKNKELKYGKTASQF